MGLSMIVLDVWGGTDSMDHLARFHRAWTDAIQIAERELAAGFLVNMRVEAAWGPEKDFDTRSVN